MLKNIHILLIGIALFIGIHTFQNTIISVIATVVILFLWIVFNIFSIKHSLFIKSTCHIRTKEKIVFLSFDDGPSDQYTPIILDTLKKKNIQSTFFCTGQHAELFPELIRRISDDGHTIGNHTYSHAWHNALKSKDAYLTEINRTNDILLKIIGYKTYLFRPPFGITNPAIANALKLSGSFSVGWDIRSFDTIIKDHQKLIKRISDRIRPGSIILLHDNRKITSQILDELIETIQKQGYSMEPILKLKYF